MYYCFLFILFIISAGSFIVAAGNFLLWFSCEY